MVASETPQQQSSGGGRIVLVSPSMPMHEQQKIMVSGKVNVDLVNERKRCSFNVEEFSEWWHGGKEKLVEKRWRGMCATCDLLT